MPTSRGAESGAVDPEIATELAEVVRAWPSLPTDVRAAVVAMVRAANNQRENQR
ncbi:MAG: hypothetical protein ACREJC_04975 [Tepidisphaeraceae bacterium]